MPRRSAILNLFRVTSPFTIIGRILTIIVYSFKGQSLRTFSHISKKGSEIMKPASADRNSSPPIIFVGRVIRVCASLFHVMPNSIFRGFCSAMRFASCAQQFTLKATARFATATLKRARADNYLLSAIALAQPSFACNVGQCSQSTKSLSLQVEQWWSTHRDKYIKNRDKKEQKNTMKNHCKYLLMAVLMLCAPFIASAQQNYLTQTTLTASVAGNVIGQGTTPLSPAPVLIQVASATGIVGINPNLGVTASQPNQTALYIDREEMYVIAVNGTTLTVVRGVNGTPASPHLTGAMVLAGKPFWFYAFDPGGTTAVPGYISNTTCVLNNVVVSPWVNVRSGAQWICNPTSLTWQPGFNNPLLPMGASFATVASAAALAVPGPVFKVSGTATITSFTFAGNGAIGLNGNATANTQAGGEFCIIPTGVFLTTAGNNIGSSEAGAVVGSMQCWIWNGPDGKWYRLGQ